MKRILGTALLASTICASPAFAQTLATDLATWQAVAGTYARDTIYGDNFNDIGSVMLDGGPTLTFGAPVNVRTIGDGWGTWSGGYTDQVLYTNGANSITVNIAPTTSNFGFFAEPNTFDVFLIQLTLTGGGSVQQLVNGDGGALFFGWNGGGVSSFTISTTDADFAFGDFYYSAPTGVPEPAAWGMLIGGFGLAGAALRRRSTKVTYATA
ncbi:PEPxxWA-CTERM sorting domain-containing protein [Sphingomonas sp. RS6]